METILKSCMVAVAVISALTAAILIEYYNKKASLQGIEYDETENAAMAKKWAALICTVVTLYICAVVACVGALFAVPHHEGTDWDIVYRSEFVIGIVIWITNLFIPAIAELKVYFHWRKKAKISPLWYIVPTILMTAILIILCLVGCVGNIADWQKAVWE